MDKKFLKIYVYPIITILFSILPWYLFVKYVLKIELYELFGYETASSFTNFRVFSCLILMFVYILWVNLNIKIERAKDDKEREMMISKWFLGYGKAFAVIISIQFLIVGLLIFLSII